MFSETNDSVLSNTDLKNAWRHESMVTTVSWGSWALFGSSLSMVTPSKEGQRRLKKTIHDWANSSWNDPQKNEVTTQSSKNIDQWMV